MAKPAIATRSCPAPTHRRPAISEPSPGVAHWLMRMQLRAVLGSRRPWAKNVFIGVHHGHPQDRHSHKKSNAASKDSAEPDQTDDQEEREHDEPMFGHHLAAQFH